MKSLVRPNIIQVAQDYGLDLKYVGNSIFTYCLWHPDGGTPNLCLYENTNSYYCFTCKVSGTVENLIAKLEHKPYFEVVKMLYGNNYEFRKLGEEVKKVEPDTSFMRETLAEELRKAIQTKKVNIDDVPELVNRVADSKIDMHSFKDILEEIRNAK